MQKKGFWGRKEMIPDEKLDLRTKKKQRRSKKKQRALGIVKLKQIDFFIS